MVREEGATGYRLIAGHHRLEAWKRHFGKQVPIPAIIYPPNTPDALIIVLKIEENLHPNELSAKSARGRRSSSPQPSRS